MTVRVTARTSRTAVEPAKPTPPSVAHHNAVLRAGRRRGDELEARLAKKLERILDRVANEAASGFRNGAADHLNASAEPRTPEGKQAALASLAAAGALPCLRADLGVTNLSTMVAVKPTAEQAAALADTGGYPAENLHVTLAYLGEVEGDLRPIADALATVAARHAPLAGTVGGYGQFGLPDGGRVGILLPDVPGLVELRVDVTEALVENGIDYARSHGFEAHVTVDADPEPGELDAMIEKTGLPLTFGSLLVVRGDTEVVEVPLVGRPALTAAGTTAEISAATKELEAAESKLREALNEGSSDDVKLAKNLLAEARRDLQRVAVGPQWTSPAADEILDTEALVRSLRGVTDPIRQKAIEAVAGASLEPLGVSFDVENPFIAKALIGSASQVTSVAATTRANLSRIIRDSYQAGLSIPDTASAIQLGMKAASGDRAIMIARTEMVGAVNGGALAAMQIVTEATGQGYQKTWMTAPGAKYPRHEEYDGLDGQTVGLDDQFDVGESSLMFPGDPDGDPADVVNCRCAMSWVEAGGETGEVEAEE